MTNSDIPNSATLNLKDQNSEIQNSEEQYPRVQNSQEQITGVLNSEVQISDEHNPEAQISGIYNVKRHTLEIPNKPYDSAFKSVIFKNPRLVLPLINELFIKTGMIDAPLYNGNEKVTFLSQELAELKSDSTFMDVFVSVSGQQDKLFHIECQSTMDGTIVLRMVQYDFGAALTAAEYENYRIKIHVNDSGVLFLRSSEKMPDFMTVDLTLPQNNTVSYYIPIIKMEDYSLEQLLENKLYVLLPFVFFNYEKLLGEIPRSETAFNEASDIFKKLLESLKNELNNNYLNAYEVSTIYDASKVVLSALGKTANADEEVGKIMGGTVLEFSADKYYYTGKNEGKVEGKTEGKVEGIDCYSDLIKELDKQKRMDDIVRSAYDAEFRNQLFEEFNLLQDKP